VRVAKAVQAKAIERAKLLERKKVIVTFDADEETMQRIAALCLLAKLPYQLEDAPPLPPCPWDLPEGAPPPELEVDYNAVRNACIKLMSQWVGEQRSREEIVAIIDMHGGDRLTTVPNDNLVLLHDYLSDRLNPKAPE
jgi:hypothetical protein